MFKILFCSLLTVSVAPAFADVPAENGLTVYSDSKLVNPTYGGAIEIRTEHLSLEDLGKIKLQTKDHIEIGSDQALDVRVFVPNTLSKAEVDAFVQSVEDQLRQNHELARVKIKVIPQVLENAKSDANESNFKKWEESIKHLTAAILGRTYDPKGVDYAVSFVGGLGRVTVASLLYQKEGGGWNPITISQSAIAATVGIGFSLFATQFSQWKAEHKFPIFKESKFAKFYNNTPIFKTGVVNEGIGFTYATTQAYLTSFVNPNEKFTGWTVAKIGLVSGARSPASAAENFAVVQMMSKGYLDRRDAQWLAIGYGYLAEATTLTLALGYKKLFWPVFIAEAGSKFSSWFFLSRKLDPKTNRIFILHPGLDENSRQGINYVNEFGRVKFTNEMVASKTYQELQDEVAKGLKHMQGSDQPDVDEQLKMAQACLVNPYCKEDVGQN